MRSTRIFPSLEDLLQLCQAMLSSDGNGKGVRRGGGRLSKFALVLDTQGHIKSQLYGLFTTTCGAGLLTSSCALTFWICAACSLSCAVRVSICFCCCATVASNFSTLPTLPLGMAGRVGAPGALRRPGALRGAAGALPRWLGPISQPSSSVARSRVTSTTLPPTGWKLLKTQPRSRSRGRRCGSYCFRRRRGYQRSRRRKCY